MIPEIKKNPHGTEQGKTNKWKTETGIYMYNYGRNIALKLQASLLLWQGVLHIWTQSRQMPGRGDSFWTVSNILHLPIGGNRDSAECWPLPVRFPLYSSPCITAAKNIEPDEWWEQEASNAGAKFNIINNRSVKRSSARIEEKIGMH